MKLKAFILVFVFVFSHYIHYTINRIQMPFYNTIYSVPDLPMKFYQINKGQTKQEVESLIGKPLAVSKNLFTYSKHGNELFDHICTYFQIEFDSDTVYKKRVVFDD